MQHIPFVRVISISEMITVALICITGETLEDVDI